MANFRLATATQNGLANEIGLLVNGNGAAGTIKIYDGSQPASANTAISSQTLLATLTFPNPAFGSASLGVITANAIPLVYAVASSTATWARIQDAAGNTVFDCDVSTSGSTIVLNTTSVVLGGPVVITAFTVTVPTG